jgi:alpha-1,3-rhamnosyl/mannosyltransferase
VVRIGFDITSAVKRRGRGISSYIVSLLSHLEKIETSIDPVFFIRDNRWGERDLVGHLFPSAERRWLIGPLGRVGKGLDGFHGMGTRLPWRCSVPKTFTLHDLRDYMGLDYLDEHRSPTKGKRKWTTIQRSSGIICPSEYGRQRVLDMCSWISPESVISIHHGVDHDLFYPPDPKEASSVAKRLGIEGDFLLQVGSFFPHKNLELSLRAFARSRAHKEGLSLIFVGGGASSSYEGVLRKITHDVGVGDRVRWVEHAEAEDLPKLYGAASLVLFPSRYEGFCLPVVETMACGTPGVVSSETCLPEVSGNLWPISGPDDPDSFSAGIDRMLFDEKVRAEAVRLGLERAKEFTWENCARITATFLTTSLERASS